MTEVIEFREIRCPETGATAFHAAAFGAFAVKHLGGEVPQGASGTPADFDQLLIDAIRRLVGMAIGALRPEAERGVEDAAETLAHMERCAEALRSDSFAAMAGLALPCVLSGADKMTA